MSGTISDIARRVLKSEADAIAALAEKVDGRFEQAVNMIIQSSGRVVVTGMGKSGIVGKKIAATLASTGTPAFFLHPAEASHGDLGMVTSDDVILAISNSGETDEVVGLIPFLKRFSVSLIAMTGCPDSTIAKAADISLDVSVKEEACPLGIVPTNSTTAALAMGDALAVALLIQRGFREEDFARFHPSGALGKKLFIKVRDLMHSGDSLPVIGPEISITGALIEISCKRLGVVVVVGSDGKFQGIITDGDIRRGLEKRGKSFFDMTASEVMTRTPKTVSPDELAARALGMMEQLSITSLLVSDDCGRAVGVLHLHDILRKGIA